MSTYVGTPQRANSISLADDGSPPNAGAINPGIVANRDQLLWLEQMMGESFAKFSARNLVPVDFSAAVNGNHATFITALGSSDEFFLAVMRSALNADRSYLCFSRDGFGWASRTPIVMPDVNSRELGAVAQHPAGWVVSGMRGKSALSSSQGQQIYVWTPTGTLNTATRGAISNDTNYVAGCFLGDRAYMIGGSGPGTAGAGTRVVTSTLAGSFLDWVAAPGGNAFTGGNALGSSKYIATGNGIALANQGLYAIDDKYIRIDAAANLVTEGTLPGGNSQTCNIVFWKGKFWAFQSVPGLTTVEVYSSVDGITWALSASLASLGGAVNAFAEGDCIGYFGGTPPGGALGVRSLRVSFDGVAFEQLPVSSGYVADAIVSTASRTMILQNFGLTVQEYPGALRVSLGGLL